MNIVRRFFLPAVLLLTATLLVSCSDPEGDAAQGQRWYALNNCSACHGDTGSNGEAISISPLNMSFYAFKKRLRTKNSQIMPYFPKDELSDDDAADIYVFLKNMK